MICLLRTLAEEVSDLSYELYLISPHQLCTLDRESRGREGGVRRRVSLFTFHQPVPVSHAVDIWAHTHMRCSSHPKDHQQRIQVKKGGETDALKSAFWWHLDTKYLITFHFRTLEARGWTTCELFNIIMDPVSWKSQLRFLYLTHYSCEEARSTGPKFANTMKQYK